MSSLRKKMRDYLDPSDARKGYMEEPMAAQLVDDDARKIFIE